jgi:hypothetical protein
MLAANNVGNEVTIPYLSQHLSVRSRANIHENMRKKLREDSNFSFGSSNGTNISGGNIREKHLIR